MEVYKKKILFYISIELFKLVAKLWRGESKVKGPETGNILFC